MKKVILVLLSVILTSGLLFADKKCCKDKSKCAKTACAKDAKSYSKDAKATVETASAVHGCCKKAAGEGKGCCKKDAATVKAAVMNEQAAKREVRAVEPTR